MFARKTKVQLALFLVIAVVGVGFTGSQYVGLDRLFGGSGSVVRLEMADSGGLFTNAEVTYRGVAVGRVMGMRLTGSGLAVDLHLEPSAPPIPADTDAVVANRSAVGEQYVDLRPPRDRGPYLADGSVIPASRVKTPPPPDSTLVNLDRLVSSVPADSLHTVVDELGTAFNNSGGDLQRLLDNTGSLTATADQHLPQTAGVLANGNAVLRTQQDQAAEITAFSSGLHGIADQFARSDPDLRHLIQSAPAAGVQIDQTVRGAGDDLGLVMANLLTTSQLVKVRQPGVEEMLVALPVISAFTRSLSGGGRGHLGIVLNSVNPPECTRGYEGTPRRPGSDISPGPTYYNVHCAEPPGSPIGVRGSQNAPRYPIPDPATAPPPLPFG